MAEHCVDNERDRRVGEKWERRFCRWATVYGRSFTAHQIGRSASATWNRAGWAGSSTHPLPDVTVWTSPVEHHEIKHKAPFRLDGQDVFGLEVYRFQALLAFANETRAPVYYTIHNHALSGGPSADVDDFGHWFTADVRDLADHDPLTIECPTWRSGRRVDREPTHVWPVRLWSRLGRMWCVA